MTHGAIRAEYETSTESPQAGAVRRLTDEAALKITAKPEQQQAINDAVEYAIEKGVIARADCDAAIARKQGGDRHRSEYDRERLCGAPWAAL
jgi:peptidyl-tRNA hydrolase